MSSKCPNCGCALIALRGEDKKICSAGIKLCGYEEDWPLKEGDSYMFKRNVEPFIENRELPPNPDFDRL